jgi:hypothetical protein
MHLRYAQPRIPVYLSRAKDIKDAFEVCPTPDPCLFVKGQRQLFVIIIIIIIIIITTVTYTTILAWLLHARITDHRVVASTQT